MNERLRITSESWHHLMEDAAATGAYYASKARAVLQDMGYKSPSATDVIALADVMARDMDSVARALAAEHIREGLDRVADSMPEIIPS